MRLFCILFLLSALSGLRAGDWPVFRGAERDGISREAGWKASDDAPIAWKAEVGLGYSAATVSNGKAIITGHDGAESDVVFCFDEETGEELWRFRYPQPKGDLYFQGGTTGTVTAEPSPSYRSQYTPPAPTRQKKPQSQPRVVNSRLFEVEYTDPDQPMTVGRVELWGTRDGGVTWQSYGFDSDSRSPMLAQVPDAGKYGFTVVFHPSYGQSAQLPQRGQKPDLHIEVDLTRPDAQLQGVDRPSDGSNALDIRWRATDSRLGQKPVSLFYADALAGQWRPIAKGIENTGRYRWKLPRNLPDKINIRIDVIDAAGNTTTAETRTPVLIVKSQPSQQPTPTSTDVRAKDVRPMSQPQQATPYNFGYGYGQ